jgi:putative hydrolase of the HAD superfamily
MGPEDRPQLRYLLLDLDNTLYPPESGLWEAIGHRINRYMIERMGMHPDEASEKRRNYLHVFGTTLNALRHYHGVDADEFLAFVHDLPLAEYLRSDPALDAMLERLPLRKLIFTNADAPHARRVLDCLGVTQHFERIIDIHALEFENKPHPRAYTRALELLEARPEECVFVDDTQANLVPAQKMGMVTVLVGGSEGGAAATLQIGRINLLEEALSSLLRAP